MSTKNANPQGSLERMVIPRELEPRMDSTTDAVRSGAGGLNLFLK